MNKELNIRFFDQKLCKISKICEIHNTRFSSSEKGKNPEKKKS